MRRRRVLSAIGAGCLGLSGCLRLQGDADGEATDGGQGTPRDGTSGGDTGDDASTGEETTEADTDDASSSVTLSEHWRGESGIDHIWQEGSRFFYNGDGTAIEALHGDGIQWERDVEYEELTDSGGGDAFATDGDRVIFGYTPGTGDQEDIAAGHFHAFDTPNGEKAWASGAPLNGRHDYAAGATIVDDVAVLATSGYGSLDEHGPLMWGVDVESGSELWRADSSALSEVYISYVFDHGGDVYAATMGGGTTVVDPGDGSVVDRHPWDVARPYDNACGQVHADTLFAGTGQVTGEGGLDAYPLGDGGVEWSVTDVDEVTTSPAVDNGLVVVGTRSGGVHAFARDSGERLWETSIPGTVRSVASSAERVWVADRETGLTAYDREDGTRVHRSTQPIDRSDIAVSDDVLLFGGDEAQAYWIETE